MAIRVEIVFECGGGELPPTAYLGVAPGSCSFDKEGRALLTTVKPHSPR